MFFYYIRLGKIDKEGACVMCSFIPHSECNEKYLNDELYIHKWRMVRVITRISSPSFLREGKYPCGMWHHIHNYMKYVQSCFLTRRHKLWSLIFLRGDSSIYTPLHYTINGDIPSNTKGNNESYVWWMSIGID